MFLINSVSFVMALLIRTAFAAFEKNNPQKTIFRVYFSWLVHVSNEIDEMIYKIDLVNYGKKVYKLSRVIGCAMEDLPEKPME